MAGRWVSVDVDGDGMRCYLGAAETIDRAPGLVVLHGASGINEFHQGITDRFAQDGFNAISPDLFHRGAPPGSTDGAPRSAGMRAQDFVSDVRTAMEHLRVVEQVDGERIGVAGFCMGGNITYLAAGHLPLLRAAVAFYPGNVFKHLGSGQDPAPFDGTERIQCPMMGLFGRDDGNPSPADVARMDAELTRLGKVHEFHSYSGAAHAFMTVGATSYRRHAAEDAWERCTGWLRRYL